MLCFVVQRRSLRQITEPIALLAQKAGALAGGQYVELTSQQMGECRELVSLGYSFAGMVEAVQERDQTVARQLEELKRRKKKPGGLKRSSLRLSKIFPTWFLSKMRLFSKIRAFQQRRGAVNWIFQIYKEATAFGERW